MTRVTQTGTRATTAILPVVVALCAVGCGLKQGYAPATVPVYTGQTDAAAAPAPAVADSLTVVSWNIQYAESVDRALAELRASPRLAAADVILLQEMDREGVERIARGLGMDYVYGPAAVHPHHARLFGNAVLSRWPIVSHDVLVLPHNTPVTGHQRIAVAADLDLGDGVVLRAISVHTATMVVDQEKRVDQAAATLDSLGGAQPVVVAGDFNTVSDWEVTLLRRVARGAGFTHLRLPPGPTIANRYKKLPGSESVLDHVLVRGVAVDGGQTCEARYLDEGATDVMLDHAWVMCR